MQADEYEDGRDSKSTRNSESKLSNRRRQDRYSNNETNRRQGLITGILLVQLGM